MSQNPLDPPDPPQRQFKGVWLCAAILDNEELSPAEKILIAEIDSLTHPEKACYASNEFLARRMHLSEAHMRDTLAELTGGGYLVRLAFTGRVTLRCVHPTLSSNASCAQTLIQRYGVELQKDGPHKKKVSKGPDSSYRKNPIPKDSYRKNPTPGGSPRENPIAEVVDCRPQPSGKSDTKTPKAENRKDNNNAEPVRATPTPDPEAVMVVSSGSRPYEAQAESDAEPLEDLETDFGLNPEQAGKLRVHYKRRGVAYVEEKAELTRAEPRKNAAAFFMLALEKNWKAPVKIDKKAKPAKPEPSKEKAPARPDYSAQWELWQRASDEQREAWRQDHLIRQTEPRPGEKPRTAFLARLHGLTQPEGVAA
jgi:hypothetical protein